MEEYEKKEKEPLVGELYEEAGRLWYSYDSELVSIEGWGENGLRVRATKMAEMPRENWALTEEVDTSAQIEIEESRATIANGKILAEINNIGRISFYNREGKLLMKEYVRNRKTLQGETCSSLEVEAREHKPLIGGPYKITLRMESDRDEKIYGMGQYQQPYLNVKGCDLELAHRNSQASVPFALSSSGYGFLWNNPAVGRVVFGKNVTSWEALSSEKIDYWITAGDTPAEIEEAYAAVTGKVPMMPDYAMGFWQCKLRYQTQDELLEIAREYKRRKLPISVIVVDFFHWPLQGEWKFDPVYWPDPDGMIAELKGMGIELMVSIWPTVDYRSENFKEMKSKGYLIRTDKGFRISMDFMGNTVHYDPTHPGARQYVWDKAKKNYYDKGIKLFWLDEAEPEYSVYDFENYRYHRGPNIQIGNVYPLMYAKTFFDGMAEEGQKNIINLLRCAWAGSQKYGALVWSGDIHSTFASLRNQYAAGLNMGLSGIPWWTTDIGGFFGGDIREKDFHELLVRWFQFGTFCPVMRLHGFRWPLEPQQGTTGGAACVSGAPNEVWTFGEEVYDICSAYLALREKMKAYITEIMAEAHGKGTPVIRPLFYDFPADGRTWQIEDEHMFGPGILVAPILEGEQRSRKVYLPAGEEWTDYWSGKSYAGGVTVETEAPLAVIPFFIRKGYDPVDGRIDPGSLPFKA